MVNITNISDKRRENIAKIVESNGNFENFYAARFPKEDAKKVALATKLGAMYKAERKASEAETAKYVKERDARRKEYDDRFEANRKLKYAKLEEIDKEYMAKKEKVTKEYDKRGQEINNVDTDRKEELEKEHEKAQEVFHKSKEALTDEGKKGGVERGYDDEFKVDRSFAKEEYNIWRKDLELAIFTSEDMVKIEKAAREFIDINRKK